MINSSTDKVERTGFGLTLHSANHTKYPVLYADDEWAIALAGSRLAELLDGSGSFTQQEIDEKIAQYTIDFKNELNMYNYSGMTALAIAKKFEELENYANSISAKTDSEFDLLVESAHTYDQQLMIGTDKIADEAVTNDKLSDGVKDYMLTDEMKEYINGKIKEKYEQDANDMFVLLTDKGEYDKLGTAEKTYDASEVASSQMTANVQVDLQFGDDNGLRAAFTPSGWRQYSPYKNVFSYLYKLDASNPTVPATEFQYNVPDDTPKYGGFKLKKTLASKSLKIIYPAWYGFVSTNDAGNKTKLTAIVKSLESSKTKTNVSTSGSFKNTLDSDAYYCIVTRGSATMTQLGANILASPVNGVDFTSPGNIVMTGYKVYFTENTVSKGGSMDANLSIKLA